MLLFDGADHMVNDPVADFEEYEYNTFNPPLMQKWGGLQ